MSYCVHCGVKLDPSLKKCPLCNTPVIDPGELKPSEPPVPTYPKNYGETETVKSKDILVLLTVALITTSICAAGLNYMFYPDTAWSLLIIGICLIVWVAAAPLLIAHYIPVYLSLLLDGLVAALYLYFISFVTVSRKWVFGLGIPIVLLITLLLILLTFLYRNVSKSRLAMALYIYLLIPVLCIGIECFIHFYFESPLRLTWSLIVTAPCIVVAIILITVLSKKRLREEVRRRLHF